MLKKHTEEWLGDAAVKDFHFVFNKAFVGLIIDRMEGNEDVFGKLMADAASRRVASEHLFHQVYHSIKDKS